MNPLACALLAAAALVATPVDITLTDTAGRPQRLAALRGSHATVLAFVGVDCPVARLYGPRLAALDAAYRARGVQFVAIDPNAHDTAEELSQFARESGITFPLLRDPAQTAAD